MNKFRNVLTVLALLTLFLTGCSSASKKQPHLQVQEIAPHLTVTEINGKDINEYGEKHGFVSYDLIEESSFDEFFKYTAKLKGLAIISEELVKEYNFKNKKGIATEETALNLTYMSTVLGKEAIEAKKKLNEIKDLMDKAKTLPKLKQAKATKALNKSRGQLTDFTKSVGTILENINAITEDNKEKDA